MSDLAGAICFVAVMAAMCFMMWLVCTDTRK